VPIAKQTGGDFTPCPPGTHLARCIGCISLGTQEPNSPQFSPAFKIMLVWEIPDELLGDSGKAMTVSAEYTCSLSEKANLRHILESWRGRPFTKQELDGFDVANVVDVPAMITVIHQTSGKGKTYAKVASVSSLPKGIVAKPRVNELVRYEIEDGKNSVYESLPEFIRKKIASCAEWIEHPYQPEADHEPDPEPPPEMNEPPLPTERAPF
jgi:hypothetical protein